MFRKKMQSKKVSIVIPVYNEVRFINACINSLLSQSYKNTKITVLDNCSTDGTTELIKAQYSNSLTHVVHSKNLGPEKNFDLCINYASGEYTCIYHSDDEYDPYIVEKQVNFLENNKDVAAVFCLAKYINEQGRVIGLQKLNFLDADSSYGFAELLNLILTNHNFLICPSLMIRTSALKDLHHWDWSFKSSADLEMWLRVAKVNKVGIINEYLISYRVSKKQWSEKIRNRCSRADFFIVANFYINNFQQFISVESFNDYLYLKIKDYFVRIKNCKNVSRKKRLFRLFIQTLNFYKTSFYRKAMLIFVFLFIYVV